MKLWYTDEATEWVESLPLGNGHMGAMCYGGTSGRYDLSENTCWSGEDVPNCLYEGAAEAMAEARRLLTEQKPKQAEEVLKKCIGTKENYGTQLPMGRLVLAVEKEPDSMVRELDLTTGVAKDILTYSDKNVTRESFISNPAKTMGVRLDAGKKKLPTICLWLEGANQPSKTQTDNKNTLVVTGRALEILHSSGVSGVSYTIAMSFETDGEISWSRRGLIIENATSLTAFVTASTSMFDDNMQETCEKRLAEAAKKGYDLLLSEHIKEHSGWMNSCTFTMGKSRDDIETNKRIEAFASDSSDIGLIALFFQYGRYLILNSSRPDSLLPAALQGVWNDDRACRMEWTDDMHLDINTQMNYYPAEVTGLGDCTMPLHEWVKNRLVPNGKRVAKELYNAEGWCAHTVSNAFGSAAPGWGVEWGLSQSCGGWIATHIWEHYLFTEDTEFLSEYYEVLYDCAKFLAAMLTVDKNTGELVSNPSYSPENCYAFEGGRYSITTGSTYDTTVTRKIFGILQKSASILNKEDSFTASLSEMAAKLPPYKIGKHGQLQEWNSDFDEPLPDHRHTCHLLSMHPFNAINPIEDEVLGQAIKISLKRRLGENAKDIVYANWAGALLITYYARLLDSQNAGDFVKPMISFLSRPNMMITHQGETTSITGGIYELDGNTGFTAAVAEMLIQSYTGDIHILPALPKEWCCGSVTGLHCYGGHIVDIEWNKETVKAKITLSKDDNVNVAYSGEKQLLSGKKGTLHTVSFARK